MGGRVPPPRVREDLTGLQPYASPQVPARHRMNTNECPYPPPEPVLEAARASLAEVNRYPDRDARAVVDALAEHAGVAPRRVAVGNGSNEILLQLMLAFGGPGRRALVFEPTYGLHTSIARIAGTAVTVRPRDERWHIPADAPAIVARLRPDVVLACSPNNPTGELEPLGTLRAVAEAGPGLVVVDEAYVEFAGPGASAAALLDDLHNLAVVRTFSKAWSLAGARIGYVLAAPEVISGIARVRLPYHLAVTTQAMAVAALRHGSAAADAVRRVVAERERIASGLDRLGVPHLASDANFVLLHAGNGAALQADLLRRGVLVRAYPGHEVLEPWVRVTAGLPEDTDAFLHALAACLGRGGRR